MQAGQHTHTDTLAGQDDDSGNKNNNNNDDDNDDNDDNTTDNITDVNIMLAAPGSLGDGDPTLDWPAAVRVDSRWSKSNRSRTTIPLPNNQNSAKTPMPEWRLWREVGVSKHTSRSFVVLPFFCNCFFTSRL